MRVAHQKHYFDLSGELEAALIAGARDLSPVHGLTHDFYKYPARFSPAFARTLIEVFTEPGDVCLDPHVGGGTTLVEALALGRNAVGVDVSTLADFVASVKTMVLAPAELSELDAWSRGIACQLGVRNGSSRNVEYEQLGYYKHLDHPSRWRLRNLIDQAIGSAERLESKRLEAFARCAILRTAQWALDGRKALPSIHNFRTTLERNAIQMVAGARALQNAVRAGQWDQPSVMILNRSAAGIETDSRLKAMPAPRLIVTSPPYPGVHVLYHRWQVDGRKESPLPFMIASKLDGAGSSFYTMGDRKQADLKSYFDGVRASMKSIASVASEDATVAQMIAFSEPSWQLPKYLATMEEAGLIEVRLRSLRGQGDGRLWREVPRRRWYSDQRGSTPASKEVVLFHVKGNDPHLPQ